MMYRQLYGLKEMPFRIVADPAYFYESVMHKRALTRLGNGLDQNSGILLLTGEIGSGKTTLVKYILNNISDKTEAAVIFNTNVSADELLEMVFIAFELSFPFGDKAGALNLLYPFLSLRYSEAKRVLLIVDEAQNLQVEALEEIRMLSNLQTADQRPLQIMLVGQPELTQKLKQSCLQPLTRRIAVKYHLTGLSREETGKYIAFRLNKAGGNPDLFEPKAVDLIYDVSKGIPRSINLACEAALVYGLADRAEVIGTDVVKQIIREEFGIGIDSAHAGISGTEREERRPAKIQKWRIRWNPSTTPDVIGYKLYWAIGRGVTYGSDCIELGNANEVVLPDGVPAFPRAAEVIEIGVTAVSENGNESDMSVLSAPLRVTAPEPPSNVLVEDA
ncbi:MAG: AAA family ATPase [Desulfatiglandaceae bacterium]